MQTNDVFSDFLSWLTSPCGHLWQAVIGVKVKTHINGTSAARLSDTVGRNPAPVEKKSSVYPIIYKVYVSQVVQDFLHQ